MEQSWLIIRRQAEQGALKRDLFLSPFPRYSVYRETTLRPILQTSACLYRASSLIVDRSAMRLDARRGYTWDNDIRHVTLSAMQILRWALFCRGTVSFPAFSRCTLSTLIARCLLSTRLTCAFAVHEFTKLHLIASGGSVGFVGTAVLHVLDFQTSAGIFCRCELIHLKNIFALEICSKFKSSIYLNG